MPQIIQITYNNQIQEASPSTHMFNLVLLEMVQQGALPLLRNYLQKTKITKIITNSLKINQTNFQLKRTKTQGIHIIHIIMVLLVVVLYNKAIQIIKVSNNQQLP